MGRDPVMNHTPNIAENNVVARRDGGKTIKQTEGHRVGVSDHRDQLTH